MDDNHRPKTKKCAKSHSNVGNFFFEAMTPLQKLFLKKNWPQKQRVFQGPYSLDLKHLLPAGGQTAAGVQNK
jgi:hypothetical protein